MNDKATLSVSDMRQAIRTQRIRQSEECLEKVRKLIEECGCVFYAEPFLTPTGTIAARMVMDVKDE